FALNDPYRGGIHANDILVFRPIFADGRVAFFAGTLIHVADVGGVSAAGLAALATDTFVEGLLLPPVRLARGGEPADDVLRIIGRNSRTPDKVRGAVPALIGVVYAVRCFADPTIPMNEGCFRPLEVHLPSGSLVNPDPPAACGGRLVTVAAATEAILQALAQAAPDRAVAASSLIHVFALSGA